MNLSIHMSRKTYMFPSLHSMMLVADSDNGAISVQMTAISSWDERQRHGLKFGNYLVLTLKFVLFLE